jgi:hypothetical protein
MKTKNYIIKITGTDYEHTKARKRIEDLFGELNNKLAADMEIYIQPLENPKSWGNCLYGLESRKNLQLLR